LERLFWDPLVLVVNDMPEAVIGGRFVWETVKLPLEAEPVVLVMDVGQQNRQDDLLTELLKLGFLRMLVLKIEAERCTTRLWSGTTEIGGEGRGVAKLLPHRQKRDKRKSAWFTQSADEESK
jgi:hypothetical protein